MANYLVTGANRGIGLALVTLLAERGQSVVAVCRGPMPGVSGGVRVERGIDLTDPASCETLAERLQGMTLDVVIHNAGVLLPDSLETFRIEDLRAQLEINALAPLMLTRALLPRLESGGKVGIVTSRMGSIGDNTSGGYYGYRMSKAAVNMAAVSLANDLRPRGIAVGLYHPGYVRTRMTAGGGEIEPEVAARGILSHLDALSLSESGGFWHATRDGRLVF